MNELEKLIACAPKAQAPCPEPFFFGVAGLAHGHIYEICEGLCRAGGVPVAVWEPEPSLLAAFRKRYPAALPCASLQDLWQNPRIRLLASAALPCDRARISVDAMLAGKDVVVDKAPVITLAQLEDVRETVEKTGRLYSVFYGESVQNPAVYYAAALLNRGVIGDLYHVEGFAPHRLRPESRPAWFFRRPCTGGILIDLLCHQLHQILLFTGDSPLYPDFARADNRLHPAFPDFDDRGDVTLHTASGVTAYLRVDWQSPAGIDTWGDARMFLYGSRGYMELRKNWNLGAGAGNWIYVVTDGESYGGDVAGSVALPYFSDLIRRCRDETADSALRRRETERDFAAIEAAIRAQKMTGRSPETD